MKPLFNFVDKVKARLNDGLYQNYHQAEELCYLVSELQPVTSLPPFRRSAISPDLGRYLYELVLKTKPRTIVECGSGVSTIILGYALKKLGKGHLLSLENDSKYAELTKNEIKIHNLTRFTKILIRPLLAGQFHNQEYLWYDHSFPRKGLKIDLLFVDGPAGFIQKNSRYGALPAFNQYLSNDSITILDDANRPDEKEIGNLWAKEFALKQVYLPTEKGTLIFKHDRKA